MKNIKVILFSLIALFIMFLSTNVLAKDYSEDFNTILTDGKLVINSIPPKNEMESWYIIYDYPFYYDGGDYKYEDMIGRFDVISVTPDFKKCVIEYRKKDNYELLAKREIEIVYNYDENVLKEVEKLASGLPEDKDYYYIDDLEIINFWINGKEDEYNNIDNYSTELKSYFKNKNVNFHIDNRAGFPGRFTEGRLGIASIKYNDTIYYLNSQLGTIARSILYVDDNATDELKAVQKRINDYVGHDKYKVERVGLVSEYIDQYKQEILDDWHEMYEREKANLTGSYLDSFESFLQHYGLNIENDEELDGLRGYEEYVYYKVKINDIDRYFIVLKDSTKMKNPEYISSDLLTNVSISSKSTKVPLDTLVGAKLLTSGEEYNRVKGTLNYKTGITFDLNLYSKSLKNYISKLDDTTFKVSIPIPADLEGKKLTVYYVATDGTKEEHEVTVENGFATFTTNHFSVYSLVDKDEVNPDTGDSISTYIILFMFSIIGLFSIKFVSKNVD